MRRSTPPAPEADADSKSDGTKELGIVQEINKRAQKLSGKRAAIAELRGPNVGRDQRPALASASAVAPCGATAAVTRRSGSTWTRSAIPSSTTRRTRRRSRSANSGWSCRALRRYASAPRSPRRRQEEDPIDVGALWKRGAAPASNPGDWWLTLPAELAPGARGHIADDATPDEPTGKASNDLIDADGNRVIEVGKLRLRVGKGLMGEAGVRPDGEAAPPGVSIEHESGSTITINQEGNVTVRSAKKLALVAGEDVTIESPANVIMKVGGFVDVKRGRDGPRA